MAGTTAEVGVSMGGGETKEGEIVEEGVGVVDDGGFCEGKFWDLSLTWETDDPDFTACFHQTVIDFCAQNATYVLVSK